MKERKKIRTKQPPAEQPEIARKSPAEIVAQVRRLAERLCEAEGMELVHVEFQRETAGRILRLYIDQPGGVTLEDCVNISRQAGDLLDVNLEDIGPYNLEVSSPGSDRPLSLESDYDRFKGNVARVKTRRPIGGQKNFKGVLAGVTAGKLLLSIGDKTVAIPLQEIQRARLVDYDGEKQC